MIKKCILKKLLNYNGDKFIDNSLKFNKEN